MGGWLDSDNEAISVNLNLTGTATGTELGNKMYFCASVVCVSVLGFYMKNLSL